MHRIEPISAFADNYIWCLHDGRDAWIVDPGDAAPVERFLQERRLRLRGILITHHHSDHIGGVAALRGAHALDAICGPHNPSIAGVSRALRAGDRIEVLGLAFDILEVPGHTLDHIAYFTADTSPPALFCGDTLFAAGCGRLFEGTPAQMHASLQKLAALPAASAVYCAHEYTQSNLRFASAVEPANDATRARIEAAAALRERGLPTLPSTLGLELATNPFLRVGAAAVRSAAREAGADEHDPVQIFAAIRRWKDRF